MQIAKKSLRDVVDSRAPKILVYGGAGVGKTTLIASLRGKMLILSAEAGLLSLAGADLDADVVEVTSIEALRAVYAELVPNDTLGPGGSQHRTVEVERALSCTAVRPAPRIGYEDKCHFVHRFTQREFPSDSGLVFRRRACRGRSVPLRGEAF